MSKKIFIAANHSMVGSAIPRPVLTSNVVEFDVFARTRIELNLTSQPAVTENHD